MTVETKTAAASPARKGFGASLARKAALITVAPVLLGIALLVALQVNALRGSVIEEAVSANAVIADLMAEQMTGGMKWGKAEVVQGVMDRILARPGNHVAHIMVLDREGATFRLYPDNVVEPEVTEALGRLGSAAETVAYATDEHVLVAAPIGEFGRLAVAWDMEYIAAAAADEGWTAALTGLLIAAAVAGVVVLFLSRSVTGPIAAITAAMGRLAAGDKTVTTGCEGRSDEMGRMAEAVERFRVAAIERDELERDAAQARVAQEEERKTVEAERAAAAQAQAHVVSELAVALSRMAEGDLTHRVTATFPPEYLKLRDDLNAAFEALEAALGQITANAETVRGAAGDISAASDDLSQRTESQAASLEESAAAIEEIASTTRKTADGAAHARQVVARAKSEAESGGAVVRDAVGAMSEIESSSEKIGQIIGVIDEIAFQTNLLALNAGVEAARAGEAGRGFAVVASEVRALAQRSADAAKQIKGLIMSSKGQVEHGVKLVGGAGAALERIIAGVAEINAAVDDIAGSAQDQATGLQEVSGAVGQMDQITQQNAAMVEEVTASVRALSAQTDEFARLVGAFRTRARPASASAPAPRAAPAKPAATVTPLRAAARKPAAAMPAPARRAAPPPPRKAAGGAADAGWEEF